jgi:hypothetical protein
LVSHTFRLLFVFRYLLQVFYWRAFGTALHHPFLSTLNVKCVEVGGKDRVATYASTWMATLPLSTDRTLTVVRAAAGKHNASVSFGHNLSGLNKEKAGSSPSFFAGLTSRTKDFTSHYFHRLRATTSIVTHSMGNLLGAIAATASGADSDTAGTSAAAASTAAPASAAHQQSLESFYASQVCTKLHGMRLK